MGRYTLYLRSLQWSDEREHRRSSLLRYLVQCYYRSYVVAWKTAVSPHFSPPKRLKQRGARTDRLFLQATVGDKIVETLYSNRVTSET